MRRVVSAFFVICCLGIAAPAHAATTLECHPVAGVCDIDVGDVALVIKQPLVVPDGAALRLHAQSIDVSGTITGNGVSITLIATGDIHQQGSVRSLGTLTTAGSVTMIAGGDITLAGNVAAPAGSAKGARGGDVTLSAGGGIGCPIGCRIDVRGQSTTPAGSLHVSAHGDLFFPVGTHLDGGGMSGGTFEFATDGNFYSAIDNRIRAADGVGASYRVRAGGSMTQPRDITVDGARGGGAIRLDAGTRIDFTGMLNATSNGGAGGTIDVIAPAISLGAQTSAAGRTGGGAIHVVATGAGGLAWKSGANARPGGTLSGSSVGPLVAAGKFTAAPGGCIALDAVSLDLVHAVFDGPRVASCP